jgi:hypothetical protein
MKLDNSFFASGKKPGKNESAFDNSFFASGKKPGKNGRFFASLFPKKAAGKKTGE